MNNKKLQLFSFLLTTIILLTNTLKTQSQTEGSLTFTFTETVSGATKNVMAVWVEDNASVFVKTKMRYWGSGTNDHLPSWKSNSGQNIVDALTGPTRSSSTNPTAFGVKTVVWDGKNASGATVADGAYKILVETSWNNPEPPGNQHSNIITFTFDKGTEATHLTPVGNTYFSNITIDWIPVINNIEPYVSNKNIAMYPNPSNGLVQLQFNSSTAVSRLLVGNLYGEIIFQETLYSTISGIKNLDLSNLSSGVYFIEVLTMDNTSHFKSKIVMAR